MAELAAESVTPCFTVLIVCSANHCRSPLAEHLLRAKCAVRSLDWEVSSAGTSARSGQPMHASAARILTKRGIDTSRWRSRILVRDMIAASDLILTAGEEHSGIIARLAPDALSRTFTLLQFAYLSRGMPQTVANYGPELLAHVTDARGRVQPMSELDRDLADPMGHSFVKFRKCASTIDQAIDQILAGAPIKRWTIPPSITG
jgi:protein-tyrosine phosphatase